MKSGAPLRFILYAALFNIGGAAAPADDSLDARLRDYFMAESATQRIDIEKKILASKDLTTASLAKAIRGLNLWEQHEPGLHELTLRLRRAESSDMQVHVRIPPRYDPARAWPLVITLHGSGGSAAGMLGLTGKLLGNWADEFIIAAPQDIGSLNLTDPSPVVARPRDLLVALRRAFHVDSDRVFLMGYSLGSHNAWMATVMHGDCWAGVVPLATPLQIIEGPLILPEILANCRNTPILFVWGDQDDKLLDGSPHPHGGNTKMNRLMASIMREKKLPLFQGVELPGVGHGGVVPPADDLARLLKNKRERFPKRIEHRYRLADQSVAWWVSSERLAGEPLTPEARIKIGEGEDPNDAKRRHLLDKLGYIDARCKGQTITLSAKRSPRLILLLSEELLDSDKPVTILRAKKKLYEGVIPRDPRVMLREAAATWDFDRLPSARVVVPISGKVEFGYPAAGGRRSR